MALFSAVFVVTGLALNLMLWWLVIRPVTQLSALADRVSQGDLDAPEFAPRQRFYPAKERGRRDNSRQPRRVRRDQLQIQPAPAQRRISIHRLEKRGPLFWRQLVIQEPL